MCGILGLYHNKSQVAEDIYDGLIQLQHRGQDAAGISTLDDSSVKEPMIITVFIFCPLSFYLFYHELIFPYQERGISFQ